LLHHVVLRQDANGRPRCLHLQGERHNPDYGFNTTLIFLSMSNTSTYTSKT